MDNQWENDQALFHKVCDLSSGEQAVFLNTLPAAQRARLQELLKRDRDTEPTALDNVEHGAQRLLSPKREKIGPYKIIERVGSGGMGAVYKARRATDFDQLVAIKLMPTVFERPELVERFRAERQILANLDHLRLFHRQGDAL